MTKIRKWIVNLTWFDLFIILAIVIILVMLFAMFISFGCRFIIALVGTVGIVALGLIINFAICHGDEKIFKNKTDEVE